MSSAPVVTRPASLTLAAAQVASEACRAKANAIKCPMNIAIVDHTTYLLHFERMPGCKITCIDISMSKAYTAAGHHAPTSTWKDIVYPGGAAYGINNGNDGKFMYVPGGIPVAQAGVDAIMKLVEKKR
ncbi:hypothetical protein M430DRAFT_47997 [Amorphotheca resinae ATCC 22711]|uniref:Uncharacterized protein n=1 Tax=Amorphotheca resinae ATCC 22711 TaxID=857342 RepID=A0A2T3BBB1_AMORE|nr:hypothetical protein M430DRAFT_47997 [Amorphotheca resinae ATCC 22711]PSS25554.1 hypothetical protein M430DRAFT_47997 [Amorphotheca resinae ATCC 22711]